MIEIFGVSEDKVVIGGHLVNRLNVVAKGSYDELKTLAMQDIEHAGVTYTGFNNIDKITENPATGSFCMELSQTPQFEAKLRADVDFCLIMLEG